MDELSQLDAAIGDGDHGAAMLRSMTAAEQAVTDAGADAAPRELLFQAGWAVMSQAGGATGPLLGSMFMGLSDGFGDRAELDAPGTAAAFEAALANVQKQTKAQPGDKTMIDALVPAVTAMRQAADAGASVSDALAQAARAAQQGAESTCQMRARFGRASNLGDRSIGTVDAGARSMSILLAGFAAAMDGQEQ
ncbi:MAG: dihydroxyacetone kinase subunit L [Delftia sp.]|nr:dihydroxyacetone kinase subunit L [Delftia sp.]